MVKKHERLPPEIEARLPQIRDEWISLGLSTERIDRNRAEAAVRLAYRCAGIAEPEIVLFACGPVEAVLLVAGLQKMAWHEIGNQISRQLGHPAKEQVLEQTGYQLWKEADRKVDRQLQHDLWQRVGQKIWQKVREHLEHQALAQTDRLLVHRIGQDVGLKIWQQVGRQVWQPVIQHVWQQVGPLSKTFEDFEYSSQHYVDWAAVLSIFRDAFGIGAGLSDGLIEMSRETGEVFLASGCAVVVDRPERVLLDDAGRLHCQDGPALRYLDGTEVWSWHGTAVPKDIIMDPEAITIDRIKAAENQETRRVMRERYGELRYLRECGATLIDADYEGANEGAAPRALMQDDQFRRFLVGTDGSTGRVYLMEVEPKIRTCREAHVALCGFDESKIRLKS